MPSNLLKKIKKAQIPNTYFALVALAFASVIGVFYMVSIGVSSKRIVAEDKNTPKAELSAASRYVSTNMQLGMSRAEVIQALGTPTWAATPQDNSPLSPPSDGEFGLEWHWANPACRDVVVMFSADSFRVIGWDDGATYCNERENVDYSQFSCTRPDRQQFCR